MKKYLSLLILFLINFTYAKSVNISSNDTTSVKQYYYSLSSNDNDELTIENSPIILVTTPEELDAVRDLPDADYVLGADIDMSGYNDFVPIPSQQTSFTGTFNGNGYTISNLSITTTEGSNTGLFSHIDEDAVVQNLNLNNITVDAVGENNGIIAGELSGTINQVSVNGHLVSVLGVSGGAVGDVNASGQIQNTHAAVLVEITKNNDNIDVGGLVGFNEGLIENSSATGNVFAYRDVGGLVGENNGGSISLCFATGDVTSDGSNVGGLVGHNDYSGTAASITKSYATGFVGLTRNTSQYFNSDGTVSDIGGLVGENDDSIIKNCYALGNVYGTDDTGGLVGDFSGGTLESSYALGRVVNTSDDEIGGLVAEDDGSGDPSMCYWIDYYTGDSAINGSEENGPELDQVTQVSASTVNTPLAAYSISDLQGANAESTMGSAGDNFFDFETIWQIAPTDMPGHFPTLQGLPAPTGAPLPPTGFKALGGNAQVQLNWESNVESDIQKYTLYRSSDSINFVRNAENKITDVSHTGSGQSYLDTNVSNNTVYYYQITATDTDGNESRSSHHGVAKPAEYSFSVSIEIVDNETNNVYKVNHGDHATDVKGSYASGQEGFIYNYRYEHLEGFLGNAVYHPSDLPNTNVTITPSGLQDNQSWYFYYDDDTVSGDPIRNTTGGAGTGTTLVTGQGNGAVVLEGVSVDFDVTYFLFYADPLPENNSTPALENLSLITISEEPVVLDQDITIIDADLSALNDGQGNYTATSLVLKRNGDANTSDNFSIIDPDAENTDYSIADGNVSFGGKVVANYDNNNGVFTLNFEGLEVIPTQTIINTITQNINFQTTNYDGLDFISWTFSDGEKETSALQQISPIWTGAVNNNWHTAGNWSKDNVPSPTENVFLPGTSNNMPIATQDVNVKYIEIASSASLALSPSAVFKVSGDLLNNGQIIFKSDATGDSHFDEFTGSITGTGTVITEKYYQNKRAFRLVSSPVDGGSLFDNWQNSGANDAGLGTHITGEVGTVGEYNATTGIDYTASGNPSLFGFSTANGWEAITDTKNTNLEAGVPYRLMVRGDRGIDLSSNASEGSTTLISTGALAVGGTSITFPSATSGGTTYAFVANPYQSRIDVSELLSNNTNANNNQLWVWDPMVNTRGAFVLIDELTTGNGTATPNTSAATKFIEPGQAFFIQSTVANPSLSFTESMKDVTTDLSVSSESITNTSELVLNLQDDNQAVIDGVRLRFSPSGNTGIDGLDITKLGNIDENLALVNNGTLFTIEHRSDPEAGEEVPLFTNNWRKQDYSFVANLSNLEDTQVYLLDQYLETETLLTNGEPYSFSVDANIEASVSSSRFKLVFRNEALSFDETAAVSYRLFPNPATTQVHINTTAVNGELLKLKLYNSLGQEVYQAEKLVSDSSVILEVNQLETGVYHLEIEDKTGHKMVEKLIKQ